MKRWHPIATACGISLLSFGLVDYNRNIEISDVELKNFEQQTSEDFNLGELMEQFHARAFDNSMTYGNIKITSDICIESYFLYQKAEKKKFELMEDPIFKENSKAEIESMIEDYYNVFAQRMSRRALIRNGYILKWFKAMVQDEFVKYYFIPIIKYFYNE